MNRAASESRLSPWSGDDGLRAVRGVNSQLSYFATPEIIAQWLALLDDPAFDDPGFRSLWSFYGTAAAEEHVPAA